MKSIACGKAHACLLIERDSGELSLYTMGSNNRGQLGVGKSLSASSEPVMVSDSLAFIKVAASKYSTFAITDQGLLYSWGSNKDGLLGLGSTSDQSLP